MATDIIFPKIGFSMTEDVLAEGPVADGASVKQRAPLCNRKRLIN